MKKIIIGLIIFLTLSILSATTVTPKSMFFADSYMLRARGCDANYWNPALLQRGYSDIMIPFFNNSIYLGNNSFNIDLYNYIMEQDYLDDVAKQKIMNAIDGNMSFSIGGNMGIIGFTTGNMSFTGSVHLAAKGALDEQFLELALYGNGDGSEVYHFTKNNNYAEGLGYADLTYGIGDISLPLPETIPDIKFGFSLSALGGLGNVQTRKLDGYLSSNLDGLNVQQDVIIRTGIGGYGLKTLLGFYSEPIPRLEVGATLDNLFGFIRWETQTQDEIYHFEINNLYASNIDEDFYIEDSSTVDIKPYTTKLPPEMRLSALYTFKPVSVSADYVVGFGNSPEVSKQGRISLGAQICPLPQIPISLGYCSGNEIYPWRMSYGIGLDLKSVGFGIAIQSIESAFFNSSTKGLALATYFNVRL